MEIQNSTFLKRMRKSIDRTNAIKKVIKHVYIFLPGPETKTIIVLKI